MINIFGFVLTNWEFNLIIVGHLLYAIVAGGLIGLERSASGRAAGFRTYALVCLSSTMLMVINAFPAIWYGQPGSTTVPPIIDPTRVVQGLMTGIGFLGAGVIVRDGFNVRGLTTAASIWAVAAIGVLIGLSFYLAAGVSTALVIGVLSVFRKVETILPKACYGYFKIKTNAGASCTEADVVKVLTQNGYKTVSCDYKMDSSRNIEYHLVTVSKAGTDLGALTRALSVTPDILEFKLSASRE